MMMTGCDGVMMPMQCEDVIMMLMLRGDVMHVRETKAGMIILIRHNDDMAKIPKGLHMGAASQRFCHLGLQRTTYKATSTEISTTIRSPYRKRTPRETRAGDGMYALKRL